MPKYYKIKVGIRGIFPYVMSSQMCEEYHVCCNDFSKAVSLAEELTRCLIEKGHVLGMIDTAEAPMVHEVGETEEVTSYTGIVIPKDSAAFYGISM